MIVPLKRNNLKSNLTGINNYMANEKYIKKKTDRVPIIYLKTFKVISEWDDWTPNELVFAAFMFSIYDKDKDWDLEYRMSSLDFERILDIQPAMVIYTPMLENLRRVFNIAIGGSIRISLKKDAKRAGYNKSLLSCILKLQNIRANMLWFYLLAKLQQPDITVDDKDWDPETWETNIYMDYDLTRIKIRPR